MPFTEHARRNLSIHIYTFPPRTPPAEHHVVHHHGARHASLFTTIPIPPGGTSAALPNPKTTSPGHLPGATTASFDTTRGGVLPQAHSCIRCLDAPRDRTQVLAIQILRVECPATNEIATYWQPFAWSVHRDGILSAKHDVPVLVRQQPTGLLDATAYPAVPSSQADFSTFMTFLASGSLAHSFNTVSRVGTHAIDAPGGSNGNIRAYFM